MSAKQVLSPMPVCEVCWLKDHAHWEPQSVDDTGNILMRLRGVDMPDKISVGSVETCSECGKLTISGIYEMKNPNVTFASDPSQSEAFRETEEE